MKRAAIALSACAILCGCSSAAEVFGLASGAVAGGASANPAVGYLVAVGVAVGADETFRWMSRTRHRGEQDAIAAVAAVLPEGQVAAWSIRHDIPLGNAHGEVRVTRAIETPLAQCREILFSVLDEPDDPPQTFATTICRQDVGWKWALAEPSVDRWRTFQKD